MRSIYIYVSTKECIVKIYTRRRKFERIDAGHNAVYIVSAAGIYDAGLKIKVKKEETSARENERGKFCTGRCSRDWPERARLYSLRHEPAKLLDRLYSVKASR